MYILASIAQPVVFRNRLPFNNSTKFDTPLYQSSIAIIEADSVFESDKIAYENEKVIGYLPFVNVFVSGKSPHQSLRNKSIKEGVYFGFQHVFRNDDEWRHSALFLFNERIINNVVHRGKFFGLKKNDLQRRISSGIDRDIPSDCFNPIHAKNLFYGINIHRGPSGGKEWNYSLGCVTVEPKTFDKFMKSIPKDAGILYVHRIDEGCRKDKNFCSHIFSNPNSAHNLLRLIQSTQIGGNND